jgi:hypothetical protein
MMLVSTKLVFRGAIDNPINSGIYALGITGTPSLISFDMIGWWFTSPKRVNNEIL